MNQISEDMQIHTDVLKNQNKLRNNLRSHYDFIVCGAGSSGCVVAARLAERENINVLLLEAGSDDIASSVTEPGQWPLNLGSERDWNFIGQPTPSLNGRALPLNMGKGLGGGSSINVMVWSRGHKEDWDYFARKSGDPAWGYKSVLEYYRRIEDWQGTPDPQRRGKGGPAYVAQPSSPQPIAQTMVDAAGLLGIPVFDSPNGRMMECSGGAAIADLRIKDGKRQSIFRSYTYKAMHQPNLTVLTGAQVSNLIFEGNKAVGLEVMLDGKPQQFRVSCEIILSLGAINTPKVLMQSGIGPEEELNRHGIKVRQHLPGIGQNHQDHIAFGCTWEYRTPQEVGGGGCEATMYWKSNARLQQPDILQCQLEFPVPSPAETKLETPEYGWTMFAGLARPKSRGQLRLSGPTMHDNVLIEPNALSAPEDVTAALAAVELCREVGNHAAFTPLVRGETAPRSLNHAGLVEFVRNSAVTYWHQSCTAKMGLDSMSVVDAQLKVYGIENLRIADASIMPRITTGNTMAPCVVIGERAADLLLATHDTQLAAGIKQQRPDPS